MKYRRLVSACALLPILALAGALACYNKKDYSLTAPHLETILSLQSVGGATTIPADGVSRLSLVARISGDTDPDKRDILFTTSAGTLIGGTPDATSGGRVVTAAGGQAPIELQSTTQIQAAVVTAQVKNAAGVAADLTVQFVAVGGNDVIRFVSVPSGPLPADGATLTPITVAVSPQLAGQKVTFAATGGAMFVDSPAPVDVNNTATGHLMSSSTIGSADVTATIGGFTRDTTVQFARALPNRITITNVNPLVIPAKDGSFAVVMAQMARDVGHVTPGAVATFTAIGMDQKSLGFFSEDQVPTADTTGAVTTQFFPGAGATTGRATITVTTPGDGGVPVTGSIVVDIVPP
jgi:hypothetical protein